MAAACLAVALSPSVAGAHGDAHSPADFNFWSEWSARPGVVTPILLGAAIYYTGLYRLWRRAGIGRGISRTRAVAYTGGLLVLVAALMSPLDAIASALFSLHMVQHLLLILVAAPLLVLGTPEVALLWALPAASRSRVGRCENRVARAMVGPAQGGGNGPLVIVVLATGVLWIWHAPQLYDLALRNDAVHTAEHVGFLVTAVLFWATVLRFRRRERVGNGMRILYVFAMAMQGSILGALITFASRPLYAAHASITAAWGLEPIVDQQLAGLIMWVPPSALYIGIAAYLFVGWLDAVAARRAARERRGVGVGRRDALPLAHAEQPSLSAKG